MYHQRQWASTKRTQIKWNGRQSRREKRPFFAPKSPIWNKCTYFHILRHDNQHNSQHHCVHNLHGSWNTERDTTKEMDNKTMLGQGIDGKIASFSLCVAFFSAFYIFLCIANNSKHEHRFVFFIYSHALLIKWNPKKKKAEKIKVFQLFPQATISLGLFLLFCRRARPTK